MSSTTLKKLQNSAYKESMRLAKANRVGDAAACISNASAMGAALSEKQRKGIRETFVQIKPGFC